MREHARPEVSAPSAHERAQFWYDSYSKQPAAFIDNPEIWENPAALSLAWCAATDAAMNDTALRTRLQQPDLRQHVAENLYTTGYADDAFHAVKGGHARLDHLRMLLDCLHPHYQWSATLDYEPDDIYTALTGYLCTAPRIAEAFQPRKRPVPGTSYELPVARELPKQSQLFLRVVAEAELFASYAPSLSPRRNLHAARLLHVADTERGSRRSEAYSLPKATRNTIEEARTIARVHAGAFVRAMRRLRYR